MKKFEYCPFRRLFIEYEEIQACSGWLLRKTIFSDLVIPCYRKLSRVKVERRCIEVESGPLTCNCRIKRGSENNSEINKFSQSTILSYYDRLSMHHCKKISFPDCRKMRFWETYLLKISRGRMSPDPLEVRAFGPQFSREPAYFKGSALLLQSCLRC